MRARPFAASCALVPPFKVPHLEHPSVTEWRRWAKAHGAKTEGEWRVHRPGEMDPIEAATLRAAALRSVMR